MAVASPLGPILEGIPPKPGCYLMKDADGRVIYVGKAVHLRSRVRSYFHASAGHDRKTEEMVAHVADIEWIVVGSELEALILEMNLIKRHRPKYNVRLKDDKRYPYIKVHWADPFPKVTRHPPHGRRRRPLFRPLHQRLGGAPDAGRPAQDLPLPDLRPGHHRAGSAGLPVPRHQAVPGAVHRRRRPGTGTGR